MVSGGMMSDTAVSVAPLRLEFVAPEGLRAVWGLVRSGLEIVQLRTSADWLPEDVYTHLKGGTAQLFVAKRWNRPVGFVVLTITLNPFSGNRTALIWICYTAEEGVVDELLPTVEKLCKEAGAVRISFQSPRRGWQRRLAKHGFKLREFVFEKRIS